MRRDDVIGQSPASFHSFLRRLLSHKISFYKPLPAFLFSLSHFTEVFGKIVTSSRVTWGDQGDPFDDHKASVRSAGKR